MKSVYYNKYIRDKGSSKLAFAFICDDYRVKVLSTSLSEVRKGCRSRYVIPFKKRIFLNIF